MCFNKEFIVKISSFFLTFLKKNLDAILYCDLKK